MIARRLLPRRLLLGAIVTAPMAAHAQPDDTAAAPVAALNEALLAGMKAGKATPFPKRFEALATTIDSVFDLDAILRSSVGLRWDQLPADQQTSLAQAFRAFTIASYTANFDNFSGQRLEILLDRRAIGENQVVATQLVMPDQTVRFDYVMHHGTSGWRIVDVLLNATISRVAVQRSDFRALLDPASAERLIRSLHDKVATLSGGTVTA